MQQPEHLTQQRDWRAGPTGASFFRMLDKLVRGDVVTVTRIDHLARSILELDVAHAFVVHRA